MRSSNLVRGQLTILRNEIRIRQTSRAISSPENARLPQGRFQRDYAQPSRPNILNAKVGFKPPPPPPLKPIVAVTVEDSHEPGTTDDSSDPLDEFIEEHAVQLGCHDATSVSQLYSQYQERGGRMCAHVIPYEERPAQQRRADTCSQDVDVAGDGLVMVVHALFKTNGALEKVCACSGFVVDTQSAQRGEREGEVVITCAHTLEEMSRIIRRIEDGNDRVSMSFVISSDGKSRRVQQILSSMPRSDAVAMQLEPADDPHTPRLRSLPLSPFPVDSGMNVLTHLFGALKPPDVTRSKSRLPPTTKDDVDRVKIEEPVQWLGNQAWRRWGVGVMLGYRSFTNIEVEAGIHSSLPHILTSILPTPGSSGGPLINAETGAVVGMISGRRMDNRVEGERGWGASSESIFEMFSLPGFSPTGQANT